jgi:hypothetical protein
MTGTYHPTQLLVEIGFHELCGWTGLELQSSPAQPPKAARISGLSHPLFSFLPLSFPFRKYKVFQGYEEYYKLFKL